MNKPKNIGTAAETAVARALQRNGFPHAERRALRGRYDVGDITGTPGVVWEVKGGEAAKAASDAQVALWLAETETERVNAGADIGVLVVQRRGVGLPNAERWWAVMRLGDLCDLVYDAGFHSAEDSTVPVRLLLGDVCVLLRAAGYGEPLVGAA